MVLVVLVDATACGVASKVKVTLDAPPADLGALRVALCARLGLAGLDAAGVRVECWDGDFEEWTMLESLADVRDKAKLRLLPGVAAEPEPAASGVEARLMQRDGASEDVHSPVEGFQAARAPSRPPIRLPAHTPARHPAPRSEPPEHHQFRAAQARWRLRPHTRRARNTGGARGTHRLHGLRRVRAG